MSISSPITHSSPALVIDESHFYKEIDYNLDVMEKTINEGKAKLIDVGFITIFRTDISTFQSKEFQTILSERLERLAKQIEAVTSDEIEINPVDTAPIANVPTDELATSTDTATESIEELGDTDDESSAAPAKNKMKPQNGAKDVSPGQGSPGRGNAALGRDELAGTADESSSYVPDWLDPEYKNVLKGRQNVPTLAGHFNLLKQKEQLLRKNEVYGLLYNLAGFGLTLSDIKLRENIIKTAISQFSLQEQLWLYLGTKNREFIKRAYDLDYVLTEKVIDQLRKQLRNNLLDTYKKAAIEAKESFHTELTESIKHDLGIVTTF